MELTANETVAATLQVLRDPAGIPSHPVVFQVLMVFTWVFHMLFVNITLGSALLSLYAFQHRQNRHWNQLSQGMTKAAKVSVSMLIVLGVAPLLFTQVIYDPQWYSSNVLSAAWAIGFIFTLILGYSSWFVFYFKNHDGVKSSAIWWGIFGLAMFVLDGFIMHVLSYQALLPEQWLSWYSADGQADMSGTGLHAYQPGRFLFFMAMSITVLGAFLSAYAHYYKVREDKEHHYLTFVNRLGRKFTFAGLLMQSVTFVWWLFDLPEHLQALQSPLSWGILLFMAVFAAIIKGKQSREMPASYFSLAMAFGLIALIGIFREALRIHYMLPFDYDITDYKVMEDIPSTALFFMTLIGVGGLVGGFFLTAIYKAGRTQGMYQASKQVSQLGSAAVGIMIGWIAIFFLTGIWVWLHNV
ncbi:hypothetical protein [Thiomicrorhabdus sp.]|uniref:hypothetical protein n=1 Tax=Thiomicrorhabdus sp. TaxID=2039724 RepID=UPI0029C77D24|nr:hypothetical protein [Thiomicrorhabdus sp.]